MKRKGAIGLALAALVLVPFKPGAQTLVADGPGEGVVVLDGFEINDWIPQHAAGATIQTSLAAGKSGQALRLDYDLKDTRLWVSVSKNLLLSHYAGKTVQFYMRGGGNTNNLEVQLVDLNGTTYGKRIPIKPVDEWQLVQIPIADFTYWWGGNDGLGDVRRIGFAVSSIEGGGGFVELDDLELVS